MFAIIFKTAVVVLGGILAAGLLGSRRVAALSDRRFTACILAVHGGLSGLLFVLVYLIANQQVTSDVPAYYVPAAHAVQAGLLPYRDFASSYAPLFPYVGAALMTLWNSPKVFALFSIILSLFTLFLWNDIAGRCFDRPTAHAASLLYATSGHVVIQCLLGTNQIWVACTLALATRMALRGASGYSGMIQGLALASTKIIALLFWPVLWVAARRRLSWSAGAAVVAALIYGTFAIRGADVLYPLKAEGSQITSGNLPYVLQPVLAAFGMHGTRLFDAAALLMLAASYLWFMVPRDESQRLGARSVVPALALVNVVFMLMSKKSFTGYLVFCMYPVELVICHAWLDRRKSIAGLVMLTTAFTWLLALEPTLWFHLGGAGFVLSEWLERAALSVTLPFMVMEALLLGIYAWLAWSCARMVADRSP